jgi:hypothetical protein
MRKLLNSTAFLLSLILALALISYIIGLNHGLFTAPPELNVSWHDEVNRINIRLFFNRTLNPKWFFHPSLFYYVTAIFYIPYLLIYSLATGSPIGGIMKSHPELTWHLIMVSRAVTVAAALFLILIVYKIGETAHSRAAGLTSAALMAANCGTNAFAHVAHPIIPSLLLMTASLWQTVSFQKTGTYKHFYYACALAGLAVSTYYNTLIVVPAVFLSLFLKEKHPESEMPGTVIGNYVKPIVLGSLLLIIFFVLATPYSVLDYKTFIEQFSYQYINKGNSRIVEEYHGSYLGLISLTVKALGRPMCAAVIAGALWQAFRWIRTRDRWVTTFFIVLIPYLLFLGSWARVESRWMVTATPLLFVMLAVTIVSCASALLVKKQFAGKIVFSALIFTVAFIWIFSYARCLAAGSYMSNDPRNKVTAWLENEFKDGKVSLFGPLYALYVRLPKNLSPQYNYVLPTDRGKIPYLNKELSTGDSSLKVVIYTSWNELVLEKSDGRPIERPTNGRYDISSFGRAVGFYILERSPETKKVKYRIKISDSSMIKEAINFSVLPPLGAYTPYDKVYIIAFRVGNR